jgi:competence protein ComEC
MRQTNLLKEKLTRFRAYQLGGEGSSFSYFDGQGFTLIEARLTEISESRIRNEMGTCNVKCVNRLHITSWDSDHCAKNELELILREFAPGKIEFPGYNPHTDNAKECLQMINNYKKNNPSAKIQKVDPEYIKSLDPAERWGYKNILYHPKYISEKSNDNSTVQLFRTGCFNVASLGDVELTNLSAQLRRDKSFSNEVDILILAHHGADNGFTTSSFLRHVNPTVAICSSNYDSQFEHPKQEIRDLLNKYSIPLYTTKTGDIVIISQHPHTKKYIIYNLKANSTNISSIAEFTTKKSKILGQGFDTVRNVYEKKKNPFRRFVK